MNPGNAVLANEIVKAIFGQAHGVAVREAQENLTSDTRSLVEGTLTKVEVVLNAHNTTAFTNAGFICEVNGVRMGSLPDGGGALLVAETRMDNLSLTLRRYKGAIEAISAGEATAEEWFGVASVAEVRSKIREEFADLFHVLNVLAYGMGIDADVDQHKGFAARASRVYQGDGVGAQEVAKEIEQRMCVEVQVCEHVLGSFIFVSPRDQSAADGTKYKEGDMLLPHFYRKADYGV